MKKSVDSPELSRIVPRMAYTKLFQSIVTSTIWTEDDPTRIVWITMLACADKNGEIQASIPGLARIAGVSVEACRSAIEKFLSPDKDSRTKIDGGRRIEEIDGGWALINYRKYRDMASRDDMKAAEAVRKARYRAKMERNVPKCPGHVPESLHIAEAEAEAEGKEERALSLKGGMGETDGPTAKYAEAPKKEVHSDSEEVGQFVTECDIPRHLTESIGNPTLKEVQAWASMNMLSPWKAEDWWNEMEGCGWLDHLKRPVKRWQSIIARVRVKWEADGRPSGPPKAKNQANKVKINVI